MVFGSVKNAPENKNNFQDNDKCKKITAIFANVELLEYLKTNKDILNMAAIERAARIPATLINRYMKTGQLKTAHKQRLREWLKDKGTELTTLN